MFTQFCTFACTMIVVLATGFAAPAHEGEDHGSVSDRVAITGAAPRAEATSDNFELVATAKNGTLTVYIDRLLTNEPVTSAGLAIETPAGSVAASLGKDGTYLVPAPWSVREGKYDLIFTFTEKDKTDILLATLEVSAAKTLEGGPPSSISSGSSSWVRHLLSESTSTAMVGMLAGIAIGAIAMGFIERRRALHTAVPFLLLPLVFAATVMAHEGEDHNSPAVNVAYPTERDAAQRMADGSLFVPKSTQRILAIRTTVVAAAVYRRAIELPGRIIPDPNASGLVQASAGGRLSPPQGGFPKLGTRVNKGDILAYVMAPLQSIDRSDMRQRQGELDQQISIVERRIARFETLVDKGAVTQVQLDEARLELQGLKDRRAALDRARGEPEALIAPVSGVVADVNAVAGQMAQPSIILFQIIEPTRLWVEALSFDALSNAHRATAKLGSGKTIPITYEGAGLAARNQAIPVHFKLEDDTPGMRIGQFVTVFAATDEENEGIAVSRASVVRTQNGQDFVFEHTSAEHFVPRAVRVESLDGDRVLLVTGVTSGVRVVTQGAELLEQIR